MKKIKSILLSLFLNMASFAVGIDGALLASQITNAGTSQPKVVVVSGNTNNTNNNQPQADDDVTRLEAVSKLLRGAGEDASAIISFIWENSCKGGSHVFDTVSDASNKLLAEKSGMSILGLVSLWSLPVIAAGIDWGINGRELEKTNSVTSVTTDRPAGQVASETRASNVEEKGKYMSPVDFVMQKRLKLYVCTVLSALVCCGKSGDKDLKSAAGFAVGAVVPAVVRWLWNHRGWRFQWPVRPA